MISRGRLESSARWRDSLAEEKQRGVRERGRPEKGDSRKATRGTSIERIRKLAKFTGSLFDEAEKGLACYLNPLSR